MWSTIYSTNVWNKTVNNHLSLYKIDWFVGYANRAVKMCQQPAISPSTLRFSLTKNGCFNTITIRRKKQEKFLPVPASSHRSPATSNVFDNPVLNSSSINYWFLLTLIFGSGICRSPISQWKRLSFLSNFNSKDIPNKYHAIRSQNINKNATQRNSLERNCSSSA